ncbi:TRAP transporter substrate-binding protein [Tianweitania sp.]|uniref:TRAP transporter substrate-binding protein n=1 Tax=Tianweitania sp. TaxID=2021634 RepID=UPI00289E11D6|nr:TRAP transporter substrate-binding protein [Tianweitania sp.]
MHRLLSKLSFATAAFSLAVTAASAADQWVLPSAYPPSNYHVENLSQFAEEVNKASGGELTITVHPNASLFKAPDIKRAVQTGQAQAGEVLLSLHENENPLFGIDVVPFLATSLDQSKKLWTASRDKIGQALAKQGVTLLYSTPWPAQGIFVKKELTSVEDLRGTKWRAYNAGTSRIAQLVGAQPVTVQSADLPQALATGTIDALMTSSATGVDSKIWESLDRYYDTQAWIPRNVVFVNTASFEALDPAVQEAVKTAAQAAETRGWELAAEKTKSYLDQMTQNGMKVEKPSPTLQDGLTKVGDQLLADWLAKAGDDGKAVVDAYRAM